MTRCLLNVFVHIDKTTNSKRFSTFSVYTTVQKLCPEHRSIVLHKKGSSSEHLSPVAQAIDQRHRFDPHCHGHGQTFAWSLCFVTGIDLQAHRVRVQ